MPSKSKPTAKAKPAPKPAVAKPAAAKPVVAKSAAKPTVTKAVAPTKTKPATPPAGVKSAAGAVGAAVSAQKHANINAPQQPRAAMPASSAQKIIPANKSAAKVAAPAAKPAVAAKPAAPAPVKAAPVKAAPVKVAPAAAAAATAQVRPGAPRAIPAAVGTTTAQRITAPPAPSAVATPKDLAQKAQAAASAQPKKAVSTRHGFKVNELVVYPAHGVGRIVAIEEQEIAGMALELFVLTFDKDKMTLRVPTGRSQSVMRKLSDEGVVKRAMETLKGRARIKRTMWSRRAQEFEQKINSGDLVFIAEVVRDLYRAETQPEQSYSERQLYEAALDRMAREIAAVERIDERGAVQRVTEVLSKSAKSRRAETTGDGGDTKAA